MYFQGVAISTPLGTSRNFNLSYGLNRVLPRTSGDPTTGHGASHRNVQVLLFGGLFFAFGGLRATFIAASNTAFTFCRDSNIGHVWLKLRKWTFSGNVESYAALFKASIEDVNRGKEDLLGLGAAFYVSDSADHLLQLLTLQENEPRI